MEQGPRLRSIVGVSRALIATVGVEEAVSILVSQFGWDTAFLAVAQLEGAEGGAALWRAVEVLLGDDVEA